MYLSIYFCEYQKYDEFMNEFSQIKTFVALVEEGLDLAIRIGTLENSSLMAGKLASVRHVVCASPDFLNHYGTPQIPQDLSDMPARVRVFIDFLVSHFGDAPCWERFLTERRGEK